jgi:hypothetical protein
MSEENKNELMPIEELEQKLAVQLTTAQNLEPLYPVDPHVVQRIDSSRKNKEIIVAAHNYPRVHQYPKLAMKFKMLIAINKTIMFVGYNVQDLEFLYEGVYEYLQEEGLHLTFEEIEIAFKRGRMDEYGEWHGLSAMTFCKWIKGYVNETKRSAMADKQKIDKIKREDAERKTPEEIREGKVNWLNWVIEQYEDFQASKEKHTNFTDWSGNFYDLLHHLELIDLSEKDRERLKKKARIMMGSKRDLRKDADYIAMKGKQLAVMEWFDKMKKSKTNVRQLLEQKKAEDFLRNTVKDE